MKLELKLSFLVPFLLSSASLISPSLVFLHAPIPYVTAVIRQILNNLGFTPLDSWPLCHLFPWVLSHIFLLLPLYALLGFLPHWLLFPSTGIFQFSLPLLILHFLTFFLHLISLHLFSLFSCFCHHVFAFFNSDHNFFSFSIFPTQFFSIFVILLHSVFLL